MCVYVLARKDTNQTPETKEPKETGLHHSEPTCQSAAQASRVKEPHSGCSTHWEVSKNSGLNKNARASPTNRPNPPNRQKKNHQKEKAGTRGAEEPDSAVTPCPFPGGIPFPCARTRARSRTWTPGAGGRRRRTAVPRRKRFTTRGRRKAHRSLKFLDVPDQPRRRVRDTLPPSSQDGSHMIGRSESNSRILVAQHGLSSLVQ